MGHVKEGPCERDAVTPDGNGRKWGAATPCSPKAGRRHGKSQNTPEVVLSAFGIVDLAYNRTYKLQYKATAGRRAGS
jgi:hypothetical protein